MLERASLLMNHWWLQESIFKEERLHGNERMRTVSQVKESEGRHPGKKQPIQKSRCWMVHLATTRCSYILGPKEC